MANSYLRGSRLDIRIRRLKIAKALAEGKTREEALRIAGYPEKTIARDSSKIISKAMPDIQFYLEHVGLTPEYVAKKLMELCEAKQHSPVTIKDSDGNASVETWTAPDSRVQQKNMELVTEIMGFRRWGKPGQTQGQQLVQVNVSFGGAPGGAATASQTALPVQVRVLNPGQPEPEQETEADAEPDAPAPEEGP